MENNEEFPFDKFSKRDCTSSNDKAQGAFSANIKESMDILDMLHDNIQPMTLGVDPSATHSPYFAQHILSASSTLRNIEHCALNKTFSDAFTLTRKYRDDLFQCLFLIDTISSYVEHCQSLDSSGKYGPVDNTNIDEYIDSLTQFLANFTSAASRRPRDNAIIGFLENSIAGSAKSMIKIRHEFFDASKYKEMLLSNSTIKNCFDSYFREIWKNIDRVLNNYVHANGLNYIVANLYPYSVSRQDKLFSELSSIITDTTTMFLTIMILIDPRCIMASDYMDALECGVTPEEGSQYWVAPGFQGYIDKHVVNISPELKKFLRTENKYGMEIL